MRRKFLTIGPGLVLACSLPSCSGGPEVTGSVEDFSAAFAGVQSDYTEVTNSEVLAQRSVAVVRATPVAVGPGRQYSEIVDDPESYVTASIEFKVDELIAGELPQSDGSRLFVEMDVPGGYEATDLSKVLPIGAPALLFLNSAATTDTSSELIDEAAGRPDGYALFAVGPQDFYLETDEAVVRVLETQEYANATLEDFEPGPANCRQVKTA